MALACAGLAVACEEPPPETREYQLSHEITDIENRGGHLGQVRVTATGRAADEGTTLRVEARFATYSGVDSAFVRARANMSTPAVDLLATGTCRSDEALAALDAELAGEPLPAPLRELSLVDAGTFDLRVGDQSVEVPYALVPDLVPWMSGLEYRLEDDTLGTIAVSPRTPTPVTLSWQGSPEADLPPFHARGDLPPPVRELDARKDGDALSLRWAEARPFGWPLRLRFSIVDDGITVGTTVTCLVDDRGRARVAQSDLLEAGLELGAIDSGAELQVEAIRLNRLNPQSGAFEEIDILLQTRDWVRLGLDALNRAAWPEAAAQPPAAN